MQQQIPEGCKQTEVGVIPEGWEVFELGSITQTQRPISYGIVQTGPRVNGGVKCLRVVDISNGMIAKDGLITTTAEISNSYKRTQLQLHDLVIPLRGKVGEVGMICEDLVGENLTRGVALIALKEGFYPKYVKQVISFSGSAKRLENAMNGSALQEIPIATLRSFKVVIPPRTEQTAIANALSDVDALITSLEKLIAKKRAIKTAAMQQLLTGKKRLPPFDQNHTGYKQTELGEIPEDWEVSNLEFVSAFITKGSTPTTYGFKWEKDGIPFLRSECVSKKGLDMTESMYISDDANRVLRRSEVRSGDVLLTITGNVGRVVYLDRSFGAGNINQHIARIRVVSTEVDPEFVVQYLSQQTIRRYFNSITTGQAYPQISLSQVRQTELPLPSLLEQKAIADVLTSMSVEVEVLNKRLSKTQQLKQGMMQELLTGRTRLI